MSKAEYRYYELSQEIPLLVLTGGSSKKNSRKRAIISMRFYPLPLIFFCFLEPTYFFRVLLNVDFEIVL